MLENRNGIEKVSTEEMDIYVDGNQKISLDRTLKEGQVYKIKVKIKDKDVEELHVLVASTKADIRVTNTDTLGDNTTMTVKIDYPDNANLTNYYSLDDGNTWIEYNEEIEVKKDSLDKVKTKSLYNEGKTIKKLKFNEKSEYSIFDIIDNNKLTLDAYGFSAKTTGCEQFAMKSKYLLAGHSSNSGNYSATFKLQYKDIFINRECETIVGEYKLISTSRNGSPSTVGASMTIYYEDGTNETKKVDKKTYGTWTDVSFTFDTNYKRIDYIEMQIFGEDHAYSYSQGYVSNIIIKNCIP